MFTTSPFAHSHSIIHRLDPRLKISMALLFTSLLAISTRFSTLLAGLTFALLLTITAYLPFKALLKRLYTLNLFTLLLFLILPLTTPGNSWFYLGQLALNQEGLLQATTIALKSNAILLTLTALLSTIESPLLGYALHQLHLPKKLIHLLLFTVRYLDVLHQEYQRLRLAMKVRGFQARANWHTYRSFAYLIGMLLVNSLDRSERILAAMKCRGFQGRLLVLKKFDWQQHDNVFTVIFIGLLIGLSGIEWIY